MKDDSSKTTKVNKPDTSKQEPLAPQVPDTNRPNLGRPVKPNTKSKSKK